MRAPLNPHAVAKVGRAKGSVQSPSNDPGRGAQAMETRGETGHSFPALVVMAG